jgi:Phage derived protein Gp49-like (DUF891)
MSCKNHIGFGSRIYVLHAFQKKSKKGIETPKRDVELIKRRYAELEELAFEHEKTKPIEFEDGSGNVFADMGLKDAGQLPARSQIGFHVFRILEDRKLKLREIADVWHCTARRVAPDERTFQPLCDG